MLPLLQAEIVKKRRWATDEELLDLYSIGQCTPGIISVNVATFMGYRQAGIAGACAATLGMVMPSLIIITLLAAVLDRYMHNRYVSYAFAGIRICVVALILDIIYDLWKKGITDYKGAGIFAGALLLLLGFNLSAVWIVILAGIAGLGLKGAAGKSFICVCLMSFLKMVCLPSAAVWLRFPFCSICRQNTVGLPPKNWQT